MSTSTIYRLPALDEYIYIKDNCTTNLDRNINSGIYVQNLASAGILYQGDKLIFESSTILIPLNISSYTSSDTHIRKYVMSLEIKNPPLLSLHKPYLCLDIDSLSRLPYDILTIGCVPPKIIMPKNRFAYLE